MGARGRKSKSEVSVIGPNGVETASRPEPPLDFSEAEAAVWVSITNSLSADYFPPGTHDTLAALCRHIISARHVHQLIARARKDKETTVADYDRLLKMQERESRMIASLATKMRLTQQSTYDKKKAKPLEAPKLWQ